MFEAAQRILTQALEGHVIHGFSLAVGKRDKPLFELCGGKLGGEGTPSVTPDTRYDLDSPTQMMITVPLLLLALENGLLTLRDPLSLYMKVPRDKAGLTLLQLLTHTAGLPSGFLLEQEAETIEDALSTLLRQPLSPQTGKRCRYSEMGFLLLGLVLEKVYAMPLDTLAKKYLCTPLGLTSTSYLPTGGNIAFTATDTLTGEPFIGLSSDKNTRFLHGVSGAAGLFTTAGDCRRYLSMLAQNGHFNGYPFLTREALSLFAADHTSGLKEAWGLGVRLALRNDAYPGELWSGASYGLTGQTGCMLAVDPASGIHAAFLCNRVHMSHERQAFRRLLTLLFTSLHAQGARMGAQEE